MNKGRCNEITSWLTRATAAVEASPLNKILKGDAEEQTSLTPIKSAQSNQNSADIYLHTVEVNRRKKGRKYFNLQCVPTSQLIPGMHEGGKDHLFSD